MSKYPHDCGDLYDDDQAQKPDASPREWTLLFKGDGYFEPHVLGAEPSDFPKAGKRTFDVIEKSAYDALARKVEELESRSWICYTCGDGLKPLKKLMEIENLNKELADAEAEIERLQHVINYDMPHPQLTQTQQRIKELEAELGKWTGGELLQSMQRKELEQRVRAESAETREAKLVAALEFYARDGFDTGDWVMDEGAKAREALKANTASAEKGGA